MCAVIDDLPARLWPGTMRTARRVFRRGNPYGVFAFGIGPDIRGGRPRTNVVLNVYVDRKLAEPPRPVPPIRPASRSQSYTVVPNVIATGKPPRAAAGAQAPFSGLHPGAAFITGGPAPARGAIACLLGDSGTATHALTAGHVFAPGAGDRRALAASDAGGVPREVGQLVANFLDSDGVDVAVIQLNAQGRSMVVPVGPPLSGHLAERSVWRRSVRAYRATTGDYSRQTRTGDQPVDALLEAPLRGSFWVRDAIGTDGEVTSPGDSGTILLAGVSSELAVGTCSGGFDAQSVFEPFSRALDLVRRDVDSTLGLFGEE
jgi:hypothetical protein